MRLAEMAIICPTVTALDPHTYRTQIERISPFAKRIHIDLADNIFAPKLIDIEHVWWPQFMQADMHLMYKEPLEILDKAISLKPKLIIVHAEADGNFHEISKRITSSGIKVGIALLAKTDANLIKDALEFIDHVLVFSGNLGHFGGQADMRLLQKVTELKQIKPSLEIGWDGGINELNATVLIHQGVDVLNVGGYIHRADDPLDAYAKLNLLLIDSK